MDDNDLLKLVLVTTITAMIFIVLMVATFILVKNKENRKTRAYLSEIIDEREKALYAVSIEVHDNISQVLHLGRLNMHILHDQLSGEQKELAAIVSKIMDDVLAEARNIGRTLNKKYLMEKRLIPALRQELNYLNQQRDLHSTLHINGEITTILPEKELMIYRIAQETIQNTLKHAQATHLEISLTYTATHFQMTITDDGKGFIVNRRLLREGLGLRNMADRAQYINGKLSINSKPGVGTKINLNTPIAY